MVKKNTDRSTIPTQEDIISSLKELSRLELFNGIELGLFGSYARGGYKKKSDVDIVYKSNTELHYTRANNLFETATKFLRINLISLLIL